jgi:hypothetical protein
MLCCAGLPVERQHIMPSRYSRYNKRRDWCENLVLLFGCASFTLFLQLVSFHSFYIILGILSTPVETLSITMFYFASFFCLVAFVAIALKFSNNPIHYRGLKCFSITKFAAFLLAAGLFIGCVSLFSYFFYNYVITVQSYRNSDGILTVVGGAFPSVLITLGGFAGTKLINCIQDPALQAKPLTARHKKVLTEKRSIKH